MDRYLRELCTIADGDLTLGQHWAYQTDMTVTAAYDQTYWDKCAGYEDGDIGRAITRGRVQFVDRHCLNWVCDVGIGSGQFVRARSFTHGTDVNPKALEWLEASGRLAKDVSKYPALTFWDVLEHIPTPADYLNKVPVGGYVFTSVPIFADMTRIRESRHYRPGEHLYYFTEPGLIAWMAMHGFRCLEVADFETRAGRDSILSFAFQRYKEAGDG